MKTFESQELKTILEKHRKWVMGEPEGERADLSSADLSYADLSSADLSYADLSYADLSYANLRSANLSYADLSYANLRYANLRYANLRSANLRSANLRSIMEDFFKVLDAAKSEVSDLYKFVWDGKIDGTAYQGDCACLVGSIANIKKLDFEKIPGLKPDAQRLAEKWFLGISKGDMPQNSPVSKITGEWLEQYMSKEGIVIPKREIVWS